MTKQELVNLLKSTNVVCDEGITKDINKNTYPRIVFWDYYWEPLTASNKEYDTNVTYQISFFSNVPRHQKLLELKQKLADNSVFPTISHEYVEENKCWHSFFAVEVLEKI